mmetsp:Transcript_3270/g.4884  ORF Transcript_3270/g.4884 Transcript_3270/m.4884 type:complete len:151 (-) Transcript_3270:95-547(-)
MQDYEGVMNWPKHSLFVFGNSGASGCYREYSHSTEGNLGIERKYMQQCRYRYDFYGHSDNRGHCTLQYNQAKSCWQITVVYRERDEDEREGSHKRTYTRRYKDGTKTAESKRSCLKHPEQTAALKYQSWDGKTQSLVKTGLASWLLSLRS